MRLVEAIEREIQLCLFHLRGFQWFVKKDISFFGWWLALSMFGADLFHFPLYIFAFQDTGWNEEF